MFQIDLFLHYMLLVLLELEFLIVVGVGLTCLASFLYDGYCFGLTYIIVLKHIH